PRRRGHIEQNTRDGAVASAPCLQQARPDVARFNSLKSSPVTDERTDAKPRSCSACRATSPLLSHQVNARGCEAGQIFQGNYGAAVVPARPPLEPPSPRQTPPAA